MLKKIYEMFVCALFDCCVPVLNITKHLLFLLGNRRHFFMCNNSFIYLHNKIRKKIIKKYSTHLTIAKPDNMLCFVIIIINR